MISSLKNIATNKLYKAISIILIILISGCVHAIETDPVGHPVKPVKQREAYDELKNRKNPIGSEIISGTDEQRKKCDAAVKKLRIKYIYFINSSYGREAKKIEYINALKSYDEFCLVSILNTQAIKIKLLAHEVIGVIGSGHDQNNNSISDVWCSATYIGNKKIITAKHCLYGTKTQNKKLKFRNSEVVFKRISSPEETYTVLLDESHNKLPLNEINKVSEINLEDDVIVLSLDSNVDTSVNVKFNTSVLQGAPLLVLGYLNTKNDSKEEWVRSIKKGLLGGCFVETIEENCLIHTCQTVGRFSGTPLVMVNETNDNQSTINIAGLHIGRAEGNDCTSSLRMTRAFNKAISSSRVKLIIEG